MVYRIPAYLYAYKKAIAMVRAKERKEWQINSRSFPSSMQ